MATMMTRPDDRVGGGEAEGDPPAPSSTARLVSSSARACRRRRRAPPSRSDPPADANAVTFGGAYAVLEHVAQGGCQRLRLAAAGGDADRVGVGRDDTRAVDHGGAGVLSAFRHPGRRPRITGALSSVVAVLVAFVPSCSSSPGAAAAAADSAEMRGAWPDHRLSLNGGGRRGLQLPWGSPFTHRLRPGRGHPAVRRAAPRPGLERHRPRLCGRSLRRRGRLFRFHEVLPTMAGAAVAGLVLHVPSALAG